MTGDLIIPAEERRHASLAFAFAGIFALFCLWLNPVGYVGAGGDDEQYLAAVRCWIDNGAPCLPVDHWSARWPVIAPVAGAVFLLGESRFAVGAGASLAYFLLLFGAATLGTRWFGWRAGAIALVALGATPVVARFAFTPSPDITELAFQLTALSAATIAFQRQSARWALLGGLLAGLAFASRNTSIVFLGASAAAWLILPADRRIVLLWAIVGLIVAVVGEMAVYALVTGNPLFRFELALNHTGIPSAALPEDFDISQSPLFNPNYIAAWEREAGLEFFWPIDGWLNLLFSAKMASILWAALIGSLLFHSALPERHRAILKPVALGIAFVMVMLTWGLAIDPKSRMFMLTAAAASLTIGAIVAATWRTRRGWFSLLLLAAHLAYSLQVIYHYPASRPAEERAAGWIAQYGERIEIHHGAKSYLTLLKASHSLPLRGSGRDMLIVTSAMPCEAMIQDDPVLGKTGRVVDSVEGNNPAQGRLCLFEYAPGYWERFPERLETDWESPPKPAR